MHRRLSRRRLDAARGGAPTGDLEQDPRLGGTLAIWFVVGATTFSLLTHAFALGANTASVAAQLGTTPAILLAGLLLHAVPELTALFLPLAAWLVASRRGEWNELLAATFVTVAIAVPVLVVSVLVEAYLSPDVIRLLITA
jgi:hypothetical protein